MKCTSLSYNYYSSEAVGFNLNASVSISYSYQKDKVKTETVQSEENLSSAILHNINGFIYLNNNITCLSKITQTLSINSFRLSLTNLAWFKLAVSMNKSQAWFAKLVWSRDHSQCTVCMQPPGLELEVEMVCYT